jgi:hypothetical protein
MEIRRKEAMNRAVDISHFIWNHVMQTLVFDRGIAPDVKNENALVFVAAIGVFFFPTKQLNNAFRCEDTESECKKRLGCRSNDRKYKSDIEMNLALSSMYLDLFLADRRKLVLQLVTLPMIYVPWTVFEQGCNSNKPKNIEIAKTVVLPAFEEWICGVRELEIRYCMVGNTSALEYICEVYSKYNCSEYLVSPGLLFCLACRSSHPEMVRYLAGKYAKSLTPPDLFKSFECVCENTCLDVVHAFVMATNFVETIQTFPDYCRVAYHNIEMADALRCVKNNARSRDVVDFLYSYLGAKSPQNAQWYKDLERECSFTTTTEYGCRIDLLDVCRLLGVPIKEIDKQRTDMPHVVFAVGTETCAVSVYRDGHAISVRAKTEEESKNAHRIVCDLLVSIGYRAAILSFTIVKMYE